jgi:hypothetical protein
LSKSEAVSHFITCWYFCGEQLLIPYSSPKMEDHSPIICWLCATAYSVICSYILYLETISFSYILWMCHAIVRRGPFNMLCSTSVANFPSQWQNFMLTSDDSLPHLQTIWHTTFSSTMHHTLYLNVPKEFWCGRQQASAYLTQCHYICSCPELEVTAYVSCWGRF